MPKGEPMETGFLTGEDWAEAERRFPSALAFFRGRALDNERQSLERREATAGGLPPWPAARLAELRALAASRAEVKEARAAEAASLPATPGGEVGASHAEPAPKFEVFDLGPDTMPSHGTYATLEEARGCVAFDGLRNYSIWHGDARVEICDPE